MTSVRESFVQLERQCLGTRVHGSLHEELRIQYEITGPGGGVWCLAIDLDECELVEGPTTAPDVIVRCSTDDWLTFLWSGAVSASALLESGRISVSGRLLETDFPVTDLQYLGVLGPLNEFDSSATSRIPTQGFADECLDESICSHPYHARPNLGYVRCRMSGDRLLRELAKTQLPDDIRSRLESVARVSRWTIRAKMTAVAVGLGLGLGVLFGWRLVPLAAVAFLILGYLEVRQRKCQRKQVEAILRLRADESPRFFWFLVNRRLIESTQGWPSTRGW